MRPLLILLLSCALAACGPPTPWRQEAYVFGTRVEILVAGQADDKARQAAGEVLREFERLHRTYHAWQPSELSALNASIAAGRPHEVSAELAATIRDAQAVAAQGGHLFDPGIGNLIALWGFHGDDTPSQLPPAAAILALAGQRPSVADLRLEGRRVVSRNRAVALDFGGYLKGVALDRAAALLRRAGIANALINIGGNVMALGSKDSKSGTPWRVGIQHPRPQTVGGAPLASLDLLDGEAIGTSGDYHRYFEVGGRRYAHLIDPRSGYPANATQAITLLIPPSPTAGMRSDALSKPLFVAGDDWAAMAKKLRVDAVLRVDSRGRIVATPALHKRLRIEAPDTVIQPHPLE